MLARKSIGHRHGALDFGRVPGPLEFHQAPKVREEVNPLNDVWPDDALHNLTRAAVIQKSVYEAQTEQSLGFKFGLSGNLHLELFTDFYSAVNCLAVSSAKRF